MLLWTGKAAPPRSLSALVQLIERGFGRMIVKRVWYHRARAGANKGRRCKFEGWFLLGIVPVYLRQVSSYQY